MKGLNLQKIEENISPARLSSYAIIAGSRKRDSLIGAYNWNKHVSSALYPIIQCLEVSLRNSLHNAASNHFKMSDWFNLIARRGGDVKFSVQLSENPELDARFYRKNISSSPRRKRNHWRSNHENMIENAKSKLQRERKPLTADAIVAELMFGFWVGMFEAAYWKNSSNMALLWPHLESYVFPNLSAANRKSKFLHPKLKELKYLRNRMSHHEPVWKHHTVTDGASAIQYLNNMVDEALKIIQGISIDRFKLLQRTGKILYFRSTCSTSSLQQFISGQTSTHIDKRKLRRLVDRSLSIKLTSPVTIQVRGTTKMMIDTWPI